MATVRLENLEKSYGSVPAVAGIDLEVRDGERLVLVGPSGSGKTTVLRLVAGLERPSAGRVWIDGADVTLLPPAARDVAMVFQNHALYPHKTVRSNLAFGARVRGVPRSQIDARVQHAARMLRLDVLLERKPHELSGGERQRVAIGRAVVRRPRVMLLDEPLSNLDTPLRTKTRTEIARLRGQSAGTMLYVTHDQEEAMALGDRIAVMFDGRIVQLGTPHEVYHRPADTRVAEFIGSPTMNLLPLRADSGTCDWAKASGVRLDPAGDPRVLVGIRPRDLELVESAGAVLQARVALVAPLGGEVLVHLDMEAEQGSAELRAIAPVGRDVVPGALVGVRLRPDRVHVFSAADGRRVN